MYTSSFSGDGGTTAHVANKNVEGIIVFLKIPSSPAIFMKSSN